MRQLRARTRRRYAAVVLATLCLLLPLAGKSVAAQRAQSGRVVGITDGDTIKVLVNEREFTVRLWGIDAPETGAEYSNRAKQHLSELVFGKDVRLTHKDTDRYGRTVAEVSVGGTNAGLDLVRQGLAWHYVEYAPNDLSLAQAEAQAKSARRNIWSLPNPLPPWEQRALQQQLDAARSSSPTARSISYHGNRNSHIFHGPSCRYYTCKNCTATFSSREAAIAAGYRPCQICKP